MDITLYYHSTIEPNPTLKLDVWHFEHFIFSCILNHYRYLVLHLLAKRHLACCYWSSINQIICDAIQNRLILSFYYKQSLRIVEQHLLGYDKNGDVTLSACKLSGGSFQVFLDFHISNIFGGATAGKILVSARQGYNQNDSTMYRVLCRI